MKNSKKSESVISLLFFIISINMVCAQFNYNPNAAVPFDPACCIWFRTSGLSEIADLNAHADFESIRIDVLNLPVQNAGVLGVVMKPQ